MFGWGWARTGLGFDLGCAWDRFRKGLGLGFLKKIGWETRDWVRIRIRSQFRLRIGIGLSGWVFWDVGLGVWVRV